MIFTERTIKTINGSCEIDKPIILYRGDFNVEVRFTIIDCPYKYTIKDASNIIEATNASFGQLVIKKPNDGEPIFSDVTPTTDDGAIVFTITGDMIDEAIELGDYDFQIRLFDMDKTSRATICPVVGGIKVEEPIAMEDGSTVVADTNEVNVARANYAVTTTAAPLEVFDEDGNYIETTWADKMLITDARLNKIEDGITGVNQKADSVATLIPTNTSQLTNDSDFATNASVDEKIANVDVDLTGYATEVFVNDAIANAQLGGGEVDLSGYAKTSDIPTNVSQLTNDAGYMTQIPSEYITETELESRGYLTEHQSLEGYARTEDIPTRVSQLTNDANYATETYVDDAIGNIEITGGNIVNNVEPAELDMPKVFIYGDALPITKDNVNLTMDYVSNTTKFSSYIKLKCQGTSSMSYDKKNFTVAMYSDDARSSELTKDFKGWGAQSKFCLKANYVDTTHTRNLSGARIAYDMVASRPDSAFKQQLLTAPRYGLVDGFPIKLYFNGEFYGIYTWNIPKDGWMFNMSEDNPNHCVLCAEKNTDGNSSLINSCQFRQLWTNGDGNDWSVEFGTYNEDMVASFNRCINFVMTATDDEFHDNIGEYFDLYSLLDYYCFSYLACHLDGLAKNMLMVTYDNVIWGASLYDMDSIYGANWTGTSYVISNYRCPEQYQEQFSALWPRIEKCFSAELYARYLELRQGALSLSNIVKHVEEIYDVIPDRVLADEKAKWTSLPNVSDNTMTRFRNYMRDRAKYVDAEMLEIGTKVPCTGIVISNDTLSFTTTDTQTLSVVVSPDNCTDTVTWSVDPTGIVTVNDGVVTPVANGACTITATCGSYSDTCAITVSGMSESGGDTPGGGATGDYVTDSLFAYYDLTQISAGATTVEDLSGNNNTFNVTSGTITKDDLGGLVYNSDNLMTISNASFNTQSTEVSIEYTFKYTGINNCVQSQNFSNKTCGINGNSGNSYYYWAGGYGYAIYKNNEKIASDMAFPSTLVNGEYYHIVCTFSTSEAKVYLNGELLGTHSHSITAAGSSGAYFLGSTTYNANVASQVLYSSRFYNKVLTQAEVTQNYTSEFTKLGLIENN